MQILVLPNHPQTYRVRLDDNMPRLVRLKWDWELPSPPERNNVPMTSENSIVTARETFPFRKDIQLLCAALNPSVPADKFDDLFKTWFPGSVEDGTKIGDDNFVSNPNYSGEIPPYHAKLTLRGNTFLAKRAPIDGKYELVSIDVNQPLPQVADIPWYQKAHLTLTVSTARGWECHPFPQNSGAPCYSALFSAAPLFIRAEYVEEVLEPPSPYLYR